MLSLSAHPSADSLLAFIKAFLDVPPMVTRDDLTFARSLLSWFRLRGVGEQAGALHALVLSFSDAGGNLAFAPTQADFPVWERERLLECARDAVLCSMKHAFLRQRDEYRVRGEPVHLENVFNHYLAGHNQMLRGDTRLVSS